jgi:hypothetical protein
MHHHRSITGSHMTTSKHVIEHQLLKTAAQKKKNIANIANKNIKKNGPEKSTFKFNRQRQVCT